MSEVIAGAGFASSLDVSGFESLRPRNLATSLWWLEAARRLRRDARTLRTWLEANEISESGMELWAEDPVHFLVSFTMGLLKKARRIKYPHCFNLEDATIPAYQARLIDREHKAPWSKRRLFWPWLNAAAGCDLRPASSLTYDVAYSFDLPSCWASKKVDVSNLISLEAFADSFAALPASIRADVERILSPVRNCGRPIAMLLLFGLDPSSQAAYRAAMARVFRERAGELSGCALAIKVHPGAIGSEEDRLFEWAEANLPVPVFPVRSLLNLEFMLPQLQPSFVLAGPCGALPVVKRLGVARVAVLSEIRELFLQRFPSETGVLERLVEGMEVW